MRQKLHKAHNEAIEPNKLSMGKHVNFFLRNEAEQFAQFILRIYQLVQERCFYIFLIKVDMV